MIACLPGQAAAAETYRAITDASFAGDGGDATAAGDLRRGWFQVDPNRDSIDIEVRFDAPDDQTRRVVIRLGRRNATGGCAVKHELVATNRSDAVVVRRPGGTGAPKPEREPFADEINAWSHSTPAIHGFVPNCGSLRLESGAGRVLDRATPSYRHTPTANARLTAKRTTLAVQEVGEWDGHGVSFDASTIVYDGRVTVDTPAGVEAKVNPDWETFDYEWDPIAPFSLKADRPGLYTVTVRITAGNARASAPYRIYVPEAEPIPATGNLAGRRVVHTSRLGIAEDKSFGNRSSVWFLDRSFAYVGFPRAGRPTCTAADVRPSQETGCKRYRYDRARNLLQVGKEFGRLDGRTLDLAEDWYNHPYGLAKPGTRLSGTWTYDARADDWGALAGSVTRLRLGRDGRFVYTLSIDWKGTRVSRGHYAVGANGRLTLRFRNGAKQIRTLGVGLNRAGRLDARRGLALSIPVRNVWGGPARDGIWLRPVT